MKGKAVRVNIPDNTGWYGGVIIDNGRFPEFSRVKVLTPFTATTPENISTKAARDVVIVSKFLEVPNSCISYIL